MSRCERRIPGSVGLMLESRRWRQVKVLSTIVNEASSPDANINPS